MSGAGVEQSAPALFLGRVCLVVGSAPCLYDDIAKAREIYPHADLCLVNGAAAAVEDAQHVVAGHRSKATLFIRERKRAFPNAKPVKVHATKLVHKPGADSAVTDWWPDVFDTGATSAIKAAKMMLALGYLPVILCGCPMDGSGYYSGDAILRGGPLKHDCPRVGDPSQQKNMQIVRYRERLRKYVARGDLKGVHSMSGLTRELLGAP